MEFSLLRGAGKTRAPSREGQIRLPFPSATGIAPIQSSSTCGFVLTPLFEGVRNAHWFDKVGKHRSLARLDKGLNRHARNQSQPLKLLEFPLQDGEADNVVAPVPFVFRKVGPLLINALLIDRYRRYLLETTCPASDAEKFRCLLGKAFRSGAPGWLMPAQSGRFATPERLEQRDQLPQRRDADQDVDDARQDGACAKQRGH